MKYLFSKLCFALIITILFSQCKKAVPDIDQLPTETQTGANTFGCLVNGKIFLPHNVFLSFTKDLECTYYSPGISSTNYSFILGSKDSNPAKKLNRDIEIRVDSVKLYEGMQLAFKTRFPLGSASASYSDTYGTTPPGPGSTDGLTNTGILYIKKLDTINNIVSGTFNFNVVTQNGQSVNITNGRFDMKYLH